jgi:Holliday junction DNA helicase RuvA
MIARLVGSIAVEGSDHLIVQVGGVGFEVRVPQPLLEGSPGIGQEVTLATHLHVRENELTLYGFQSDKELNLFRLLLGVSGIGPKVGLAILSSLPPDALQTAISQEDIPTLARVPGIGPKTAKKLVFDLKDKVQPAEPSPSARPAITEADADLIAALTTLGYSVVEAQEAMAALPREPLPVEERVRLALAYFAQ